jgi:hypothetical protein
MFDTLAGSYESITKKSLEDGDMEYTIVPHFGAVHKLTLKYSPKTNLINKIVIESFDANHREDIVMTLNYSYTTLTSIPSLGSYLNKSSQGDYTLKTTWKGYELLDYVNPRQ